MLDLLLALAITAVLLLSLQRSGRLAFLKREFPSRPRRYAALLLLCSVLTLTVVHPALMSEAPTRAELAELSFPALFAVQLVLGLFLLVWRLLGPGRLVSKTAHQRISWWNDVRYGLRLGLIGWVVTLTVTALLLSVLQQWSAASHLINQPSGEFPAVIKMMAELSALEKVTVIAVAMTVEEAFFRGFLQTRIGYVASSLIFALGHASYGIPSMLLGVFIISLFLGWGYRQTGRLLPSMAAHGVFDAIQLFIVIPLAARAVGS